jgi:hypothetical protein
MAVQTDYAQLKAFYNGSPITQITSCSLNTEAGNQRVELMGEGLGGWTTGSGACTIEIGFVIPIGGQEFDYQQDCANHAFVDMQIFIGRNSYAGRGKISSHSVSQGTGAVTEGTFTWDGELKPLD